jgi:hypothetical protein
VNSLNLYSNNVQNITSGNRKDFSFPVNNCTTIVIINEPGGDLYINSVLVYQATGGNYYTFTLGKKGLYKFNTGINLSQSTRAKLLSYTQIPKSEKMLQIDQGRIDNNTSGDLFINNVLMVPTTGPGTIVIDIGNDIDIINDTLILQNVGSQTGYIIERLI